MNTSYHLKVNGQGLPCPEISAGNEIKFSWESPEHLKQFTFQLSPMPDFIYVQYLRDTDRHVLIYDGPVLKAGMKYYWRVRTGIYGWTVGEFVTTA